MPTLKQLKCKADYYKKQFLTKRCIFLKANIIINIIKARKAPIDYLLSVIFRLRYHLDTRQYVSLISGYGCHSYLFDLVLIVKDSLP